VVKPLAHICTFTSLKRCGSVSEELDFTKNVAEILLNYNTQPRTSLKTQEEIKKKT